MPTKTATGRERGVTMRFVYFYSMKDDPDVVRAVAPKHALLLA
jgi:hypothetical protein